jgi:hypothetical protein
VTPAAARIKTHTFVVWGSASGGVDGSLFGRRLADDGTVADGPVLERPRYYSGHPPSSSRFMEPQIVAGGDRGLIVYVDSAEISGGSKSVQGVLVFPW